MARRRLSLDPAAGSLAPPEWETAPEAENGPPVHKQAKTTRTHLENRERAFIAASRRSDRSLEARVKSARNASEVHRERTGKRLKISDEIVANEEVYEEEDLPLPIPMRKELPSHMMTGNTLMDQRAEAYATVAAATAAEHHQRYHGIHEAFAQAFSPIVGGAQQQLQSIQNIRQPVFVFGQPIPFQPQLQPQLQPQPPPFQPQPPGTPTPPGYYSHGYQASCARIPQPATHPTNNRRGTIAGLVNFQQPDTTHHIQLHTQLPPSRRASSDYPTPPTPLLTPGSTAAGTPVSNPTPPDLSAENRRHSTQLSPGMPGRAQTPPHSSFTSELPINVRNISSFSAGSGWNATWPPADFNLQDDFLGLSGRPDPALAKGVATSVPLSEMSNKLDDISVLGFHTLQSSEPPPAQNSQTSTPGGMDGNDAWWSEWIAVDNVEVRSEHASPGGGAGEPRIINFTSN